MPIKFALRPREIKLIFVDIAILIPPGHYGCVALKSGITFKHHVNILASVEDPDYTDNVGVILHNLHPEKIFRQEIGNPITQLILEGATIVPVTQVSTLLRMARGPHGFGECDLKS